MAATINVLLDTFPGLSLPPTVCLPLAASTTASELLRKITDLLPESLPSSTHLQLTTNSNRQILFNDNITLAEFVRDDSTAACRILPLRLSAPLCGGKGGFGSQLRAAGGRMSSRKRRQNAELASGSARNLDGRRLRTITEAKNLAAYLATKPDMDRKEREEKRKRWEQIVELSEQREADMRSGKGADGRRKGLSDEWIETKEEVGENVRNAVKLAMKAAEEKESPDSSGSSGSAGSSGESDGDDDANADLMELDEDGMTKLRKEAEAGDADAIWVLQNKLKIPSRYLPTVKTQRRFAGFDDDDISSSENDGTEDEHDSKAKGKAKAKV